MNGGHGYFLNSDDDVVISNNNHAKPNSDFADDDSDDSLNRLSNKRKSIEILKDKLIYD